MSDLKGLGQIAEVIGHKVDEKLDELDQLLNDDDALQSFRQKRLAEMKKEAKEKEELRNIGHGEYSELSDEREFFEVCKKSKNVVCHFYRDSTMRCNILDMHLKTLAPKHIEAKFCKINAEKSLFLAKRLNITVLPSIVLCKNNKISRVIVGFDEFGGTDEFSTATVEKCLAKSDIIEGKNDLPSVSAKKGNFLFLNKNKKTISGPCRSDDTDSD